ncbi:TetR/AcrR family transcriptional regulator [Massilia violaceinigra]|uniref:TetR/AcrR family transcriptional regulator n=1 Tax=Massilia violaceinigra TaxID=2045208 RepID=A0ABY4A7M9_9BURK|nr:TetR/AcrR family transcriptional regulator [Massilia violaceinigra]UOD29576.1 TetR/AcrR family transcriptional regulator [Massilia violaceinigra]
MDAVEHDKRGAGGRPAAGRKGEVDARLLDAATRLFLTLGFDATSCDQVALDARAGKASIYARYANKGALFAAVIESNLARLFATDAAHLAEGPLRERMTAACLGVVEQALQPDAVALLRLLVAEAPRMRDMALSADQLRWRMGVGRVAEAIAARSSGPDAIARATVPAAQLIDIVLAPALMRALLGEDEAGLMQNAKERIGVAIDFLAARGALDSWD